jgi:hypothetical protein
MGKRERITGALKISRRRLVCLALPLNILVGHCE